MVQPYAGGTDTANQSSTFLQWSAALQQNRENADTKLSFLEIIQVTILETT